MSMKRDPGKHLTDEEFLLFVNEDVPPELEQPIDEHIERCESCSRELEEFYNRHENFPEEQWRQRKGAFIGQLWEQIRDTIATVKWPDQDPIRRVVSLPRLQKVAASARVMASGDIRAGSALLHWTLRDDEAGNLNAYLHSKEMSLNGHKLRMWIGALHEPLFERVCELRQVAPDQLATEKIVITADERKTFPQDAELQIEIVPPEAE